ncbi:MAG: HTH domain-containing protein [Alphaproteobacteria bacterium]|nr:HTH domain-containing protein [Alphaproteobacteria bacterium]
MRASRLLQMLLLLQNRGRMTSLELAEELEVARRTVLRDIDALSEAGLPIVVHRGNQGGVELGFNYRTRLTGLSADEAEALAVILSRPTPELAVLGLASAGARARAKMLESFPDGVRERIERARGWFCVLPAEQEEVDPRVEALAQAIRGRRIVRVRARSGRPRTIHPVALACGETGWQVVDQQDPSNPIPLAACGDINISARSFA